MIINLCIFGTFVSSFIVAFIYIFKYENPRILYYSLIDKIDLSLITSILSSFILEIILYWFQNPIMKCLNNRILSLMFPDYKLILMIISFIIGIMIGSLAGHLEKLALRREIDRKLQIEYEKEILMEIQINNEVQGSTSKMNNKINELALPYSRLGYHQHKE